MSAGEWAAVAVAGVAAVAVVALVATMAALLRTLGALQQTIDTLRAETIPLVTDVQQTARRASSDLERAGAVLQTAESLSSTVDSASPARLPGLLQPRGEGDGTGLGHHTAPTAVSARTAEPCSSGLFWLTVGAGVRLRRLVLGHADGAHDDGASLPDAGVQPAHQHGEGRSHRRARGHAHRERELRPSWGNATRERRGHR